MTHTSQQKKPDATPISEAEAEQYQRTLAYMRKHFRTATLKDIAAHAGYSMFHFHRLFTRWAGRTPKAVLTEIQMELARRLILEGRVELPEVARRCGFSHHSHLTSRFKVFNGQPPVLWRRSQVRARQAETADAETPRARAA